MESNVAGFQYNNDAAQRLTFGKEFLKLTGCHEWSNVTCLQNMDAHDVIGYGEKASGSALEGLLDRILEGGHIEDAFAMQWSPVVDMKELTDQPLKLFDSALGKGSSLLDRIRMRCNIYFRWNQRRASRVSLSVMMDAIFSKM